MTIGDRIKARRIELGMSQSELAKRMGIKTKSTICQLENSGDNITTDRIRRAASALGVEPSDLMGWKKEFVAPEFEEEHIELIRMYSMLSSSQKEAILNMLRSMTTID